jgi:hypothetical protein
MAKENQKPAEEKKSLQKFKVLKAGVIGGKHYDKGATFHHDHPTVIEFFTNNKTIEKC